MQLSIAEVEELSHLRDNVRRSVELLEQCWSCQRISECEPAAVDHGPPVWLCAACSAAVHAAQEAPAELAWPSAFDPTE